MTYHQVRQLQGECHVGPQTEHLCKLIEDGVFTLLSTKLLRPTKQMFILYMDNVNHGLEEIVVRFLHPSELAVRSAMLDLQHDIDKAKRIFESNKYRQLWDLHVDEGTPSYRFWWEDEGSATPEYGSKEELQGEWPGESGAVLQKRVLTPWMEVGAGGN